MRLEKELSDDQIANLGDTFGDLIKSGKMYKTNALPDEKDEPQLGLKPRIAFSYNRRSAGRLNEMILAINDMGKTVGAGTVTPG